MNIFRKWIAFTTAYVFGVISALIVERTEWPLTILCILGFFMGVVAYVIFYIILRKDPDN